MNTSPDVNSSRCRYFPSCQGCSHWHISYAEQKNTKINTLQTLLKTKNILHPTIQFVSCGESGLRARVDFTIQRNTLNLQQMGFYNQNKELLNIEKCLQMNPALQALYHEFQQIDFPIQKGSVRLRVGPSGIKGAWLDFSNLDIKKLLDHPNFFNQLFDKNIEVEVGQKGKKVTRAQNGFKLTAPEPNVWFETYDLNLKPIPLKGLISDFTQPSWLTARALIEILLNWTKSLPQNSQVLEFGPGLGSFTLPLLSKDLIVSVFESNESATTALELNAHEHQLRKNLKINLGDFQNKSFSHTEPVDLALVNPPRSGLKKFTTELIKTNAHQCIYISCFPESMVTDLEVLSQAGYQIKDIQIVDQFPQTHHFESCILLEKII